MFFLRNAILRFSKSITLGLIFVKPENREAEEQRRMVFFTAFHVLVVVRNTWDSVSLGSG